MPLLAGLRRLDPVRRFLVTPGASHRPALTLVATLLPFVPSRLPGAALRAISLLLAVAFRRLATLPGVARIVLTRRWLLLAGPAPAFLDLLLADRIVGRLPALTLAPARVLRAVTLLPLRP